jgi:hypothetical protein
VSELWILSKRNLIEPYDNGGKKSFEPASLSITGLSMASSAGLLGLHGRDCENTEMLNTRQENVTRSKIVRDRLFILRIAFPTQVLANRRDLDEDSPELFY